MEKKKEYDLAKEKKEAARSKISKLYSKIKAEFPKETREISAPKKMLAALMEISKSQNAKMKKVKCPECNHSVGYDIEKCKLVVWTKDRVEKGIP